jgi:hypothetical protein
MWIGLGTNRMIKQSRRSVILGLDHVEAKNESKHGF